MKVLRGRLLLLLSAAVLAAHLWLVGEVVPARLGAGAADTAPRRIEVSFVRELAPVATPPRPVPRPRPRIARLRQAWAAAPAAPAQTAEPLPQWRAEGDAADATTADALSPLLASLPDLPVPTDAALAALAASAWPPSTRLSYRLTGNVRGPVYGQARVEWLRAGTRYQVFLEASVGPALLPFMTRRESSAGEITPAGLSPQRYEMETLVMLRDPRRSTIHMDAERVRFAGGLELPRPPGLQDAVSQFVQLTWLFTTQPQLLVPGGSVEWPLALSRRVLLWTYDVQDVEALSTSAGEVAAVHLKPRRAAPPGDYTAEVWVAPGLQYLPVRILVRQNAETYIDLQLERLPEQAEQER